MKHQIIFTSRTKDFFTGQDGKGVFSADMGFVPEKAAELEKIYNYSVPSENTEEGIGKRTVLGAPVSFCYKPSDSGCIISKTFFSLNKVVTHLIQCSEKPMYNAIEYIDSESFISKLEEENANAYLPEPNLVPGNGININKVMKFLGAEGRGEIFVKLLSAVIECKKEQKRVIICDEPENVALWIGAISFALPETFSQKISFCTYSYDPDDADVDICGVLPSATAYQYELYSKKYRVFDVYNGYADDIDSGKPYFNFIKDAMEHDFASVSNFNEFIINSFSLDEKNFELTSAYEIYKLLKNGPRFVSKTGLDSCCLLLENAHLRSRVEASAKICTEIDTVCEFEDITSILICLKIMCSPYSSCSLALKEKIRAAAAHSVFVIMVGVRTTEQVFESFYKWLEEIASDAGFSITDELMISDNRSKLIAILSYRASVWKTNFAVDLLVKYIKKNGVKENELDSSESLGSFVTEVINSGEEAGLHYENACSLIVPFASYTYLLCSLYKRSCSALSVLPDAEKNIEQLREKFGSLAAKSQLENRAQLFKYFAKNEDYETIYTVFAAMIKASDIDLASDIFDEHYKEYLSVIEEYSDKYLVSAIEEYYAASANCSVENKHRAAESIFDIISSKKLTVPCAEECIACIYSKIEFDSPSAKDKEKINAMAEYTVNVIGKKLSGKLLCLRFGVECDSIDNKKDYFDKKTVLSELVSGEKVNLIGYEEKEWEDYFDWILPQFTSLLLTGDEISALFNYFIMLPEQKTEFCKAFAKEFLKDGRNESDYSSFCSFLPFLFNRCGDEEKEGVAILLKKLNSKRMELLRIDVEEKYSHMPAILDAFYELISMPVKKQGFLSGLFKKK